MTASAGLLNEAEELLAVHLQELGLHFDRQFPYAKGRKFKADFAVWRDNPDKRLKEPPPLYRLALIEVVGGIFQKGKPCPVCGRTNKGAHGSITGILKDNERLFEAFKAGWPMLRFTPQQVESGEAKAMIEAALKRDSGKVLG
jgi:hypothetical protein